MLTCFTMSEALWVLVLLDMLPCTLKKKEREKGQFTN